MHNKDSLLRNTAAPAAGLKVASVFARCAEESWYGKSILTEEQWCTNVDRQEPRYVTVNHPRCYVSTDSKLNTMSGCAAPASPSNSYMTSQTPQRGGGSDVEKNCDATQVEKFESNCLLPVVSVANSSIVLRFLSVGLC